MFEYVKNGLNASICLQKPLDLTPNPALSRALDHRHADLSAMASLFKTVFHDE